MIASDISGIPELVIDGDTGLLVNPRDVKGLVSGLEHYFHDPDLRKRLGKAGKRKVVEEFDLKKNAMSLVQNIHSRDKICS